MRLMTPPSCICASVDITDANNKRNSSGVRFITNTSISEGSHSGRERKMQCSASQQAELPATKTDEAIGITNRRREYHGAARVLGGCNAVIMGMSTHNRPRSFGPKRYESSSPPRSAELSRRRSAGPARPWPATRCNGNGSSKGMTTAWPSRGAGST